jgi:tetratricopeptide (TPR) repeat protein
VEAKGESERAEALNHQAILAFANTPDADPRQFADFLTDAGFLYLKLQRPSEAVQAFQQACNLRESIPGEPALNAANAISNLAIAHFEAGDFASAIPLYQAAIRLRHANQKPIT